MNASRVLTVLAAMCLVAAFALAILIPPLMPLGQVMLDADRDALSALQHAVSTRLAPAVWSGVVFPCLERPSWLLPMMFGIVFGGLAASFRPRRAPQKRRRSG